MILVILCQIHKTPVIETILWVMMDICSMIVVTMIVIGMIRKVTRPRPSDLPVSNSSFSGIFQLSVVSFLPTLTMDVLSKQLTVASFNSHRMKGSLQYVLNLAESHQIVFLNEHWLQVNDIPTLRQICELKNILCYLKSSVDPSKSLNGRPHGGVGFLYNRSMSKDIAHRVIDCDNDRIYG